LPDCGLNSILPVLWPRAAEGILRRFLKPPKLWPSHSAAERRVTWMELFFDLIFVAAVAQVGVPLQAEFDWWGLLRYCFLFSLIWSAWSGHTLFATRFDNDDTFQRLANLVQCFIAAVMAANAKDALDSRSSAGFGAAYACMRLVLVAQYLRVSRIPETRTLTLRSALGIGVAACIWIASALAPLPFRYFLWIVGLLADRATTLWSTKKGFEFPPHASHFPERLGVFTIILLGEFVAAVMRGIESQEDWTVAAAVSAFASLSFAFVVWWWYFDLDGGAAERRLRSRRDKSLFRVWTLAHPPLFLGIGVASAGFERLISMGGLGMLPSPGARIACLASASIVAALITIGCTTAWGIEGLWRSLFPHLFLLGVLVVIAFFAQTITSVWLVLALLAMTLAGALVTWQTRTSESVAGHDGEQATKG